MNMIKNIKAWFFNIRKVKKVEENIPFIILEQDFIIGKKVIMFYKKDMIEEEDKNLYDHEMHRMDF